MKIQYVSKYLLLAEKGLVPRLDCPMDQGPLMPNMDENDIIYTYCLSCTYKNVIGMELYDKITKKVDEVGDK
jgi:hypothetical protein